MLIYNKEGKLVACTSDDVLKPLGFESVEEFFDIYDDLSEIFIPQKGYIASYENISWINLVFNDILPKKQVLVNVEGEEQAFTVIDTPLFSNDMDTVSITFTPADTEQKEQAAALKQTEEQPQTSLAEKEESQEDKDELSKDENDQLLELLNLEEPKEEPKPQQQEEEKPQEEPKEQKQKEDDSQEQDTTFDDLEEFALELKEDSKPQEDTKEEKQNDQSEDELEELYNLDLELPEEKEQAEKEQTPSDEDTKTATQQDDDKEMFTLDLDEQKEPAKEDAKQSDEDIENLELDFTDTDDEKEKESQEFEQYIDSKEYANTKEVNLQNLSNELGLEEQECANFILDFTNMVQAKEKLLRGENASVEAAGLKNIAENFRLTNIVKTLETIEDGEANANLLFSQISKLQNELKPYTKEEQNPQTEQNGAIAWSEAKKTPVEFDPNVAAESLGLPTELINEFVADFIEQAKESKEIFDEAYAKKELESIQENAHKLKGAAANLRIEPIATTLEELQHNSDIEAVPQMLKDFWGMYLGLKEVV